MQAPAPERIRPRRWSAAWGLFGIAALLVQAIVRLMPRAIDSLRQSLSVQQKLFGVTIAAFMLYTEGYRAFHLRFVPRVVGRIEALLGARVRRLDRALAPFFAMSLVGDTPRRRLIQLAIITAIVGLILFVRLVPQPWRGLIDFAVCLALGWGAVEVVVRGAGAIVRGQGERRGRGGSADS